MERIEERYLRPLLKTGPGYLLSVGVLLALIAWALYAYSHQLKIGLGVTGMNAPTFWGLYIVNFVFFIGLSAGGVIVASLVHAFDITRFKSIARIAELLAISCLLLATIFIMLDLGRPDRFYHLLLHGRLESPLIWDVIVITVYLLTSLAYGYFGARGDLMKCMKLIPERRWLFRLLALGYTDASEKALARDRKILRALAVVALPLAVALHSVTAWILGLVKARPGWYSALLAPLFVVSATVSGLALVILVVVLSKRLLKLQIEEEIVQDLGRLLSLLIPVLGYFLFAELLTVTYSKEPAELHIFREMIWGRYSFAFWFNLVLGLVVPLLILLNPPRRAVVWVGVPAGAMASVLAIWFNLKLPAALASVLPQAVGISLPPWIQLLVLWLLGLLFLVALTGPGTLTSTRVGIAAALVVFGVLAERWNIVVPSLLHVMIPSHGIFGSYTPTWVEYSLVVGVYALGALFFAVCAKLFPLVEIEETASR